MEQQALHRALERERKARKLAETLLEEKSRQLYDSFQELEAAHNELKHQQAQMVQSEKMASLGVLSAGVAHEINNPIGFVLSNLTMLHEYIPVFEEAFTRTRQLLEPANDSEPQDKAQALHQWLIEKDVAYLFEDTSDLLGEMEEGLIRIRDIVSGLQSFARIDKSQFEPTDLAECLRSTLALVKIDSSKRCEIVEKLNDVPLIHGNHSKLGQVFMNLIVNAIQAMPEAGGQVELCTKAEDGFVYASVRDNGSGISAELQEKIFEPFFTTKDEGQGTGLGLAISKGIIEEHQGEMLLDSEPGRGTCFTLKFPVADCSASLRQA